jgi:hypothetical protein
MDLYARNQFDVMLALACESFSERVVQRCAGSENALRALREDPNGEGVWLDQFVTGFFDEWLLNDASAAAFVLVALEKRPLPADPGGTVTEVLQRQARIAFAELLRFKVDQALQQAIGTGM